MELCLWVHVFKNHSICCYILSYESNFEELRCTQTSHLALYNMIPRDLIRGLSDKTLSHWHGNILSGPELQQRWSCSDIWWWAITLTSAVLNFWIHQTVVLLCGGMSLPECSEKQIVKLDSWKHYQYICFLLSFQLYYTVFISMCETVEQSETSKYMDLELRLVYPWSTHLQYLLLGSC